MFCYSRFVQYSTSVNLSIIRVGVNLRLFKERWAFPMGLNYIQLSFF